MEQHTASLQLHNGLQVKLASTPAATRAAALVLIDAGSYQEPDRCPGLAHLLEHVLFRGSERFRDEACLIRWLPARGGRLNASTMATQTAFFFEAEPEYLDSGVERLIDMLHAPCMETAAIAQEVNIIDAEYHLLCNDAETLCEAAAQHAFSGIPQMQRLRIGHRDSFGQDIPALQQALAQFHQRYYRAGNMTLWLQGPQPLEQLRAIAKRHAAGLRPGNEPVPAPATLTAQRDYRLRLPGFPQLRLTFALNLIPSTQRGWLRLLECLLLDEAPGSLIAWLREQRYADAVQLRHMRCGQERMLLSFTFRAVQGTPGEISAIETTLLAWLRQLTDPDNSLLQHYQHLANQAYFRMAPVEQLRASAFGLPLAQDLASWPVQVRQLLNAPVSRLWVREQEAGEHPEIQGLPVSLVAYRREGDTGSRIPNFTFWMMDNSASEVISLPSRNAPLAHLAHQATPVLLLRPVSPALVTDMQGYCLQAALRGLSAEIKHEGGHLSVERVQGIWLVQISGHEALLCRSVNALNRQLASISSAAAWEGERLRQYAQMDKKNDIAIRRLAAQLPDALAATGGNSAAWCAILVGGNPSLRQKLATLLSQFSQPLVERPSFSPVVPGNRPVMLSARGEENALLLFYPLSSADDASRLALRLLARIYAPHYFQRLRVERNTGYAVQCQFYRCVDVEGMLFTLQSPHFAPERLYDYTIEFLQEMAQQLPQWPDAQLQQAKRDLARELQCVSVDELLYAREKVVFTPPVTEHLETVDLSMLLNCHRKLFTSPDDI